MSNVIHLENISFSFPDEEVPVLSNFSMSIEQGERVVITGPSGCGKSTLLYLCNRLYPDNCDGIVSGKIELFGKDSDSYRPGEVNHRIATVFQDPDAQFCMPTVEEELAFTLENLLVAREDMDSRISEVLEATRLTAYRHSIIQSLSGGMKQRVATACALIMKPEVLLLDEPITHLDPYTAKQYIEWLDTLQQSSGLTILAIEHKLDLWEDFFHRRIRLKEDRNSLIDDVKRDNRVQQELSLQVKGVSTHGFLQPSSFSLHKGEVAVLAGPNGSGKSTLLKALSGVLPAEGNVLPSLLGYVPQSPEFLFVTGRVKEEVSFGGGSNTEELLERLDLSSISEAHPFSISHGQKRRLAIAVMLCQNREVILMDEPTSGQDSANLTELLKVVDERSRAGTTFLIVTHDMEFAYKVADSILLMRNGGVTGKYSATSFWDKKDLMLEHQLLPPKRGPVYAC
ncbi:ABC transporter ATP-binding protein [Psychrobacillus sp. MER TA 171]|uniref:ABC transporter ATP-binding protein n=1 Tax=Psychrobacillus sp. MER TA 171 TaxID=2939577 RepID=UPI00203F1BE8|nr:energy-coupling factor ABC transporter ATP-binding protein [Psychrobacillus sp. MER TA 171]